MPGAIETLSPVSCLRSRVRRHAGLVFPALLEPEPIPRPEPQHSCADPVVAREQDLLINVGMATIASQYIYKLLHRQPVTSFVSYVSADGMSVRSVPIYRDELLTNLQVEV